MNWVSTKRRHARPGRSGNYIGRHLLARCRPALADRLAGAGCHPGAGTGSDFDVIPGMPGDAGGQGRWCTTITGSLARRLLGALAMIVTSLIGKLFGTIV